jgi:hypothetical protein
MPKPSARKTSASILNPNHKNQLITLEIYDKRIDRLILMRSAIYSSFRSSYI